MKFISDRVSGSWAPVVVVAGLVYLVFARIATCVTGQDPMLFIGLARKLLLSPVGSDEFKQGLLSAAPGYPLLLAAVIKGFGSFAVYAVNPVLGVLFFVVFFAVVKKVFDSERDAWLSMLIAFGVLVFGFALNPYFLFYPFRELPCFLFLFLGLWLVTGDSFPRHLAAGCCFLLAVAFKETMAFAVVGPLLWLWTRREHSPKRNAGAFFAAILPFLAALALLFVVMGHSGRMTSLQVEGWIVRFKEKNLVEMAAVAWKMTGFLVNELGWAGLLLLAIGFWAIRKNRAAWFFFVVPAVLSFLFLSTYIAHRRYFLTVLVLLCPVLCQGALAVLQRLALLIGLRSAAPALSWLAGVAVLSWIAWSATALQPWGPHISRAEVRQFQQHVTPIAAPGSGFVTEHRCRVLRDALTEYTGSAELYLPDVAPLLEQGMPCFYFRPLDDRCFYTGSLDAHEPYVPAGEILKYNHHELVPIRDSVFTLGGGRYEICAIRPVGLTVVRQDVDLTPGKSAVLWLDFRAAGAYDAGRTVRLLSPDGKEWAQWVLPECSGLQGLVLEPGQVKGDKAVVEVAGEKPMASDFVHGVQAGGQAFDFRTDDQRSLSVDRWFTPPFIIPERLEKYAGVLDSGGRLLFPPIHGPYRSVSVTLIMSAWPARDAYVTIDYDGRQNSAALNTLIHHTLTLTSNDYARGYIDLQVEPLGCLGSRIRVHMIRLSVARNED